MKARITAIEQKYGEEGGYNYLRVTMEIPHPSAPYRPDRIVVEQAEKDFHSGTSEESHCIQQVIRYNHERDVYENQLREMNLLRLGDCDVIQPDYVEPEWNAKIRIPVVNASGGE